MLDSFAKTAIDYRGYEGFKFDMDGHECKVIPPQKPTAEKRWVWRAEFLGAFDTVDLRLLEQGWYVVYCSVSDQFGCPESIAVFKKFHDLLVKELGLCPKADIFGFSRGGLYATNYTLTYPEDICVLYLDAPVLNMFSWPQGKWDGVGSERDWELCVKCWNIDQEHPEAFRGNPVDHIDALMKTKVPVALVAGGSDTVVPYHENGQFMEEKMKAAGYDCLVIVKPACGHHPHSLEDPTPVAEFIANHRP